MRGSLPCIGLMAEGGSRPSQIVMRASCGHPRRETSVSKTWMAGTSPAMTGGYSGSIPFWRDGIPQTYAAPFSPARTACRIR